MHMKKVIKYVITDELVVETEILARKEKHPAKKLTLYKKARFFKNNIGKFLVKIDG